MVTTIQRTKDSVGTMIDGARDAVVDIADRVEHGVEAAAGSASARVTERAHTAGDYVRGGAENASRGAHRKVADAAETANRNVDRAKHGISRAAAATTDQVVQSPLSSLLLASVSGFLLGLLIGWRRD